MRGVGLRDPRRGALLDDVDLDVARRRAGRASPAWPATASGSCTRWRSACGAPTDGHGHHRRRAARAPTRPRRAQPPAPSACPRTRSRDAVVPGPDGAPSTSRLDVLRQVRKGLGIDWGKVRERVPRAATRRSQLRGADGDAHVASLSGGNIQRVMLVRASPASAKLVVAAYPSRGLDIATTRRTQELLLERRAGGAGVLLICEDLDELFELSDRIAVMHGGEIVGIVDPRTDGPLHGRPADARRRRPATRRRTRCAEVGAGMTAGPTRCPTRGDPPDGRPDRRPSPRAVGSTGCADRCASSPRSSARSSLFGIFIVAQGRQPDHRLQGHVRSTFTSWDSLGEILVQVDADHPRRAGRRRPGPRRADQRRRRGPARSSAAIGADGRRRSLVDGGLPGGADARADGARRRGRRRGVGRARRRAAPVRAASTSRSPRCCSTTSPSTCMFFLIYDRWKDRNGTGQPTTRPLAGGRAAAADRRQPGARRASFIAVVAAVVVAGSSAGTRRGASACGSSAATPRRPAAPGSGRRCCCCRRMARRRRPRRPRRLRPVRRRRVQAAPGLHRHLRLHRLPRLLAGAPPTRCRSALAAPASSAIAIGGDSLQIDCQLPAASRQHPDGAGAAGRLRLRHAKTEGGGMSAARAVERPHRRPVRAAARRSCTPPSARPSAERGRRRQPRHRGLDAVRRPRRLRRRRPRPATRGSACSPARSPAGCWPRCTPTSCSTAAPTSWPPAWSCCSSGSGSRRCSAPPTCSASADVVQPCDVPGPGEHPVHRRRSSSTTTRSTTCRTSLVPVLWWVLYRSRWGVLLRAAGERSEVLTTYGHRRAARSSTSP